VESVQILNRKEKQLRNKMIPLVNVLWRSQKIEEATWEPEEEMQKTYPQLFQGTSSFEDETSLWGVEQDFLADEISPLGEMSVATIHSSITEHLSTRPVDEISPTWRQQQDFSTAGFFLLGEIFVHSTDGIFLTQRRQCRHAHMLFLDRPTGVETLHSEIFPTQSPSLCCRDYSLSELPIDAPLMRFFSLKTQTLAYELPLSALKGRWINPSIHISQMRFPPLGKQLWCEISPTRRITLSWVYSHSEVPDRHSW